jgi:hypothetical protein
MTLVARLAREDRIHELHVENGVYELRLFVREPHADHELTREEASEWIDVVKKSGGTVRVPRISPLTPRPAAS